MASNSLQQQTGVYDERVYLGYGKCLPSKLQVLIPDVDQKRVGWIISIMILNPVKFNLKLVQGWLVWKRASQPWKYNQDGVQPSMTARTVRFNRAVIGKMFINIKALIKHNKSLLRFKN